MLQQPHGTNSDASAAVTTTSIAAHRTAATVVRVDPGVDAHRATTVHRITASRGAENARRSADALIAYLIWGADHAPIAGASAAVEWVCRGHDAEAAAGRGPGLADTPAVCAQLTNLARDPASAAIGSVGSNVRAKHATTREARWATVTDVEARTDCQDQAGRRHGNQKWRPKMSVAALHSPSLRCLGHPLKSIWGRRIPHRSEKTTAAKFQRGFVSG